MNTVLDPYVLGLVAASTPCFGYHERGNATCGGCPLAERCVESRAIRATTVAAQLVKAAKAAARVEKSPAPSVGVPAAHVSGESIDDILASIDSGPAPNRTVANAAPPPATTPATATTQDLEIDPLFGDLLFPPPEAPAPKAPAPKAPAPKAPAPKAPAPKAAAHGHETVMNAVIESVCHICGGKIPAQTQAVFIPGKGLRHTTCM